MRLSDTLTVGLEVEDFNAADTLRQRSGIPAYILDWLGGCASALDIFLTFIPPHFVISLSYLLRAYRPIFWLIFNPGLFHGSTFDSKTANYGYFSSLFAVFLGTSVAL